MLFNGSNLTASANDLEWNGRKWSIVNHFIPFTEEEVGAPERFESDFMVQYLQSVSMTIQSDSMTLSHTITGEAKSDSMPIESDGMTSSHTITDTKGSRLDNMSNESKAVLAEGKKLWQAYFAHTDVRTVRDELKLNRADVGWYQVRKALQARNASGDVAPVSFKAFEEAYKTLSEKLQPMVYELGFLRV
jgi:hypothetical protein